MDSTVKTKALILRSTPSGDADLILHALTEEFGKVSCIAKHARRGKKGNSIPEPLDFGLLELKASKSNLFLLRSYSVQHGHIGLRDNLTKLSTALLLCEASDFIIPEAEEESRKILLSLLDVLAGIEKAKDNKSVMRLCFLGLSSILDLSGYLNLDTIKQPSSHSLLKLMNLIENTAHRKLNTRSSVELLMKDLAA
ncbi:MAG: recombination protein O N-terminal domain-containing protein [Bdellovibrionota bacterium]